MIHQETEDSNLMNSLKQCLLMIHIMQVLSAEGHQIIHHIEDQEEMISSDIQQNKIMHKCGELILDVKMLLKV